MTILIVYNIGTIMVYYKVYLWMMEDDGRSWRLYMFLIVK